MVQATVCWTESLSSVCGTDHQTAEQLNHILILGLGNLHPQQMKCDRLISPLHHKVQMSYLGTALQNMNSRAPAATNRLSDLIRMTDVSFCSKKGKVRRISAAMMMTTDSYLYRRMLQMCR